MANLNDKSRMPLGKHRGTPMGKVPDQYLLESWEKNKERYQNNDLKHTPIIQVLQYVEDNLDAIQTNLNK